MENNLNSYYIKTVLLSYWRYNRQCICATEVGYSRYLADIIVLKQNNYVSEIEVKTAKSDLCHAELNKNKHYKDRPQAKIRPNYFSFAVPTCLVKDAEKLIKKINPKYGLIEIYNGTFGYGKCPLITIKAPKLLHNDKSYIEQWKDKVSKRLCSDLIGYMTRTHCK